MTSNPKKFYTSVEAAALLMVSPVTVREWARKGVLPSVSTAGGHRRFLLEGLREFAAAHGIRLEHGSAGGDVERMRVLVVDDDAIFAKYLHEIIVAADPAVHVERAGDGFEAGQLTETLRPQLVVIDVNMPRVDGIELCRRLRRSATTGKSRLVVLSAALTADNIASARTAGADAWLEKGASRAEILRVLGLTSAESDAVSARS
jgi:excisionase family DNA binding protein